MDSEKRRFDTGVARACATHGELIDQNYTRRLRERGVEPDEVALAENPDGAAIYELIRLMDYFPGAAVAEVCANAGIDPALVPYALEAVDGSRVTPGELARLRAAVTAAIAEAIGSGRSQDAPLHHMADL